MILVAVGANLPLDGAAPIATCRAAIADIRAIPGVSFVADSSWYRSPAVPRAEQPDYCNGVVRLQGEVDPAWLLAQLQAIENRYGRQRSVSNAARTLDLDIIDINGLVRAIPDPILPHPRAHLRAFVLRPILDVALDWRHPALQSSAATLLAALPAQEIALWEESESEGKASFCEQKEAKKLY
jgi:2-amino-4-hydroxy-6-hydroxymethyldihydropteridine diphosphokinase